MRLRLLQNEHTDPSGKMCFLLSVVGGLVVGCDVGCKIVCIYKLRKVAKLPSVQITRPAVELGLFGSGSSTWKLSSFVALRRTRPPSRALTVTRSSAACLVSEERSARPAKLAS